MPFDFKAYDLKCSSMIGEELQREWEHYTRLISGSATSTAVSGAAIPFTLGVSVIGVGLAAPAIHNARKKREIIERHLNRVGTTHHTRKRDVLTPMAVSGTVGVVTLGVGGAGAGAITNAAAEHGISAIAANEIAVKATTHLAVDGVAMLGEEHHMKQKKAQEAWKAQMKRHSTGAIIQNPAIAPSPMTVSYSNSIHGQQLTPGYFALPPMDNKLPHLGVPSAVTPISQPATPSTPAPPYSALEGIPVHPITLSKPTDISYFNLPLPPPAPPALVSEKLAMENKQMYFPPPPTASQRSQTMFPPASPQPPATPSFSWMGDVKRPLQDFRPAAPPAQAQYMHNASQHPTQNFYGTAVQQTPQLVYPSYPGTTTAAGQCEQSNCLVNGMHNMSLNVAPLSAVPQTPSNLTFGPSGTARPFTQPEASTFSTVYTAPVTAQAVSPWLVSMYGNPTPVQTPGSEVQQHHYQAYPGGQSQQNPAGYGPCPLPTPGITPQNEKLLYFAPPPQPVNV